MNHIQFGLSLTFLFLLLGVLTWRPMRRLAARPTSDAKRSSSRTTTR